MCLGSRKKTCQLSLGSRKHSIVHQNGWFKKRKNSAFRLSMCQEKNVVRKLHSTFKQFPGKIKGLQFPERLIHSSFFFINRSQWHVFPGIPFGRAHQVECGKGFSGHWSAIKVQDLWPKAPRKTVLSLERHFRISYWPAFNFHRRVVLDRVFLFRIGDNHSGTSDPLRHGCQNFITKFRPLSSVVKPPNLGQPSLYSVFFLPFP